MSFETRLKNPEYQNWLKCGHALQLLVGSLRQFADDTITTYHDQLKTQLGALGTCQQQCKPKNKPPDTCTVCCPWRKELMKNHSTKQVYWTNVDPKLWPGDKWEMAKTYMPRGLKPHVTITAKTLDSTHMLNLLKNCKAFHQFLSSKKLPEKVLQKRNQMMHSSNMTLADDSLNDAFDVFLQFLQDKTTLHQFQETQEAVLAIQELRQMAFDINISGGTHQQQSAQPPVMPVLTAKKAKKIEEDLIRDMMKDFEIRLEALEIAALSSDSTEAEKLLGKNIADLQNFVNSNVDLKKVFGSDLESIRDKCDHLEEKVEEITEGLEVMGARVDALENQPPAESEISADTEPTGLDPFMLKAIKMTASVVVCLVAIGIAFWNHQSHIHSQPGIPSASYKNLLQEITQAQQIDSPKYECFHDEYGNVCHVFVSGKTYKSPSYYHTKLEAQQNAAKVAYNMLRKKEVKMKKKEKEEKMKKEEMVVSPALQQTPDSKDQMPCNHHREKSVDKTNYVGQLQEFQQKQSLRTPEYISKLVDNMKYIATVHIELPDGNDTTFESPVAEKSVKDAKHGAAKKAMSVLLARKQEKLSLETTHQPSAAAVQQNEAPEKLEHGDTNYKGKLNIHQQRLKLNKATFSTTSDGTKFRATVTVPIPGGGVEVFESITAEASKKAAEHAAAKKALLSLVGSKEPAQPAVKMPPAKPKPDAGAVPKVQKAKTASESSDGSIDSSTQDYKGDLQRLLQKSQSISSLPKYEDIEVSSQLGTYRSKVIVNTKYMLQNDRHYSSKKDAEKDVAKRALQQLGVADLDKITNLKGKLQELYPNSKPVYKTEEVEPKKFLCTLVLAALEEENEVVFYADQAGKTKKERKEAQQQAAKKVLDLLSQVGKA